MSSELTLSFLAPTETQWPVLWGLADRLREVGYTESRVSEIMGVPDHGLRDYKLWPAHVRRCRLLAADDPCALLAAFFLAEEQLPEKTLSAVLGAAKVAAMSELGWIGSLGDRIYFRFYLYPLLGCFILTDGPLSNSNPDHVYQLGADSHSLARLAPRPRVAMSLDHCTGSGVQAIMAAPHSQRSVGVDINPRALQVAAFNARWNKRDQADFVRSDCYESLTPQLLNLPQSECRFELITANPPYVPTPDPMSLCRGGGLSGEEVTEKIYRGLDDRLARDGIFSMVTNIPVLEGETFFERSGRWLSTPESWGMLILTSHVWSPTVYALSHGALRPETYGAQFDAWLEAYESIGMREVTNSHVYCFRSPYPWRVERAYDYPTEDKSAFIAGWLRGLQDYAPGRTYRPHQDLEKIWWVEDASRVYLQWKAEARWWNPRGTWLEGSAARAFSSVQATGKSAEEEGLRGLLADSLVVPV